MKTKKRWTTPPIYKREVEKKLDKIIELLEEIKQNTTPPPVLIPTIWTDHDSDNYDYKSGDGWITVSGDIAPDVEACTAVADDRGQYSPNPNCNCSRCNSSDGTGGCVICKCRNIAIFTEDGNWWCNKCYRERHMLDGSPRPDLL